MKFPQKVSCLCIMIVMSMFVVHKISQQLTALYQKGYASEITSSNIPHEVDFSVVADTADSLATEVCDFPGYQSHLRLSGPVRVLPRHYLAGCTRLVYNRVPKCASRTMKEVFSSLTPRNNFTVIFIDEQYKIDAKQEANYIKKMENVANQRFVLVSHHYYHNWTRFYNHTVLHINILREPVYWFQSVFNWHKLNGFKTRFVKMPIGSCIASETCFNHWRSKWGPMTFLCGQNDSCLENSAEVLQIAKKRIHKEYVLVGFLEQLGDFNTFLEYLLPGVFSGLSHVFKQLQASYREEFKTVLVDPIREKTFYFLMLKEKMRFESELYAFARQRFQQQLLIMEQTKALALNGI